MARQVNTASRDRLKARREQIIEESIRIVGERGYYGFTVQDLAQRCGISHGTLFYHFGSKDLLLVEMLNEFVKRETQAIAPILSKAMAAIEGEGVSAALVGDVFRTIVGRMSTQPEIERLAIVLRAEALDPSHPAHATFKTQEATGLDLYARLLAPYTANPRSKARQLAALMQGLAEQWVREDYAFDLVEEWDRAAGDLLPA